MQPWYVVVKTLVGTNNQKLIAQLVSDRFYVFTFGCLECTLFRPHSSADDPTINITEKEFKYRAFFFGKAKLINTACVENPDVLKLIQLNYRLQFLKDTAAAQWIEEVTLSLINNVSSS